MILLTKRLEGSQEETQNCLQLLVLNTILESVVVAVAVEKGNTLAV